MIILTDLETKHNHNIRQKPYKTETEKIYIII